MLSFRLNHCGSTLFKEKESKQKRYFKLLNTKFRFWKETKKVTFIKFLKILDESIIRSKDTKETQKKIELKEEKNTNEKPPSYENINKYSHHNRKSNSSSTPHKSTKPHTENINKYLYSNRSGKTEASSHSLNSLSNIKVNTLPSEYEWRDENGSKNSFHLSNSSRADLKSFKSFNDSFDLLDLSRNDAVRTVETPHEWRE